MATMEKNSVIMDTITMTYEQKILFMAWVNQGNKEFADFWNHIHEGGRSIDYFDFTEKQLMQAWIFPSTIKEPGEDVDEEANRKVIEDIISSTEEELRSVELYGDPDSAETRLTSAEYDGQIDGSKEVLSGRYTSDSSFIRVVKKDLSDNIEKWEKENGRQFNYYDEANKEFLPSDDIDLLVEITYNQAYITAFDIAYDTINK